MQSLVARSALARTSSLTQDHRVKLPQILVVLMASLVPFFFSAAGQVAQPVEMAGKCRGSGIGEASLRRHQAQALERPECDLAVAIGDASLAFFRSGDATPQVLFSGRVGRGRSFDVEIVRIGNAPAQNAIAGDCLRNSLFIMCHAVFAEGDVRKGIALSFDLKRESSH